MEQAKTDVNSGHFSMRSRQIFIGIFAAIALFMTAYATSGGVKMFLAEPYAWIGITALAVGFLALTSLVLGDGISSGKISQVILISPFFIIALVICWILSFASYHQQFLSVGKSDAANAETNLTLMGNYAHDVVKQMNDHLDEKRAVLANQDEFLEYSQSMTLLADELNDPKKREALSLKLQSLAEETKIEIANRRAKSVVDERRLRESLKDVAANIEAIEKSISENQASYADTLALVAQLETALKLEEGDPDLDPSQRPPLERDGLAGELVNTYVCKRRRAAGDGGGSPGTCYFALTEKLKETNQRGDEVKAAIDNSLEDLKRARKRQSDNRGELKELLAQNENDKLTSSEEYASDFNADTDGFLKGFTAFATEPSEQAFRATAEHCENVTNVLASLDTELEQPNCAPGALNTVFTQFNLFDEQQDAINLACDEADRRERIAENLRGELLASNGSDRQTPIAEAYHKLRTEVLENCLATAEQFGLATGPVRDDLTNLYDRINPSQDPISKAMGKVYSLFDATASARDYFPALLALLQELSLLLTKLFWDATTARKSAARNNVDDYSALDLQARPDDPMSLLAAKNLVLNSVSHGKNYLLPHIFDEDYSPEMQKHMQRAIDTLVRRKLAKKSSKGIVITEDGMALLASQISRHNNVAPAANVEPASENNAPEIVEVTESENAPVDATVSADERESQISELPASVTHIRREESSPITDPELDENVEKLPRKRRPIIVRPNFRREV